MVRLILDTERDGGVSVLLNVMYERGVLLMPDEARELAAALVAWADREDAAQTEPF